MKRRAVLLLVGSILLVACASGDIHKDPLIQKFEEDQLLNETGDHFDELRGMTALCLAVYDVGRKEHEIVKIERDTKTWLAQYMPGVDIRIPAKNERCTVSPMAIYNLDLGDGTLSRRADGGGSHTIIDARKTYRGFFTVLVKEWRRANDLQEVTVE